MDPYKIVVALSIMLLIAICTYGYDNYHENVKRVEVCEKSGGVSVLMARSSYACIKPDALIQAK